MRKKLFTLSTYHPILFILIIVGIFSCTRDKTSGTVNGDKEMVSRDKVVKDSVEVLEEVIEPELQVSYRLDSLKKAGTLDSLLGRYNENEKKIIFALNRIEPVRVGVGTNLIIPDTLLQDFLKYAPFPQNFKLLDTIPKTVLISQRIQGFALYEKGKLIHWGPVSSGKQSTPTPNGLHYGNYKAKHKVSTVNSDWKLPYYFNFMNFEGVGVHQYLLPGFPASHACVRLYMEDARLIYDWAEQWELDPSGITVIKNGTPFMVFGEYNFAGPSPWEGLILDSDSNDITDAEMEIIKEYVREYLKDKRNFIIPEDPEEEQVEI